MKMSFNDHVRSDKAKWWIVTLCLIIVGVILCGIMTSWFKDWNPFCWFGHMYDNNICVRCGADKPAEDPAELEQANGSVVIETISSQSMKLLAAPAEAAANEEERYTLTAIIQPESADDKRVEWTIGWKNADSLWAIGKNVTDYATITPTSEYALTASCSILQDFGEQIIVTVRSLDNAEATAKCTIDYVQRITSFTFNIPYLSSTTTPFTYEIEYCNYTIAAEVSFDVSDVLSFNEDFENSFCPLVETYLGIFYPPKITKVNDTLVLSPNKEAGVCFDYSDLATEDEQFILSCDPLEGLAGCFIAVIRSSDAGDVLYEFRKALNDWKDIPAMPFYFELTYFTTYNGKIYSQGTQTVGVSIDGQSLHIPVTNINMSQGSIIVQGVSL